MQQYLPADIYASIVGGAAPHPAVQLLPVTALGRGTRGQPGGTRQQPQPLTPYTFEQWLRNSSDQLRASHGYSIPFHRDFRFGFGLSGTNERRDKMTKIIDGLRDFHVRRARHLVAELRVPGPGRDSVPPVCTQPFSIYGAEREGKTNAQVSAQRAALDMGFATVVFVAPTKVAPVVDMHTKLFTELGSITSRALWRTRSYLMASPATQITRASWSARRPTQPTSPRPGSLFAATWIVES